MSNKLHLVSPKGGRETITNKRKLTTQYDLSSKKIKVLRADNVFFTKKRKASIQNNHVTKKIKLFKGEDDYVTFSFFTNKRKASIENNPLAKKIKVLKGEDDYVTEKQNVSPEEKSFFTNKRKASIENNRVTKKIKLLKGEEQNVSVEDDYFMENQSVYIPEELIEHILVRLDVKNLLRCKSVCKSWKSLISSADFIKAHQDHSFNDNDNGHTRSDHDQDVILPYYYNDTEHKYFIVGSSNGLVCINSFDGNEFIVANPWTREERMVSKHLASEGSCWGFGYDPVTNDYKIVFGVKEGESRTSFQVLYLKSNVWKHVGHTDRICHKHLYGQLATLCNGALHWLMDHEGGQKSSIISFDLSKEVFKEIPQPDDARYNPNKEDIPSTDMMLGIKDECLCIWRPDYFDKPNMWIMQKYGVKESWVTLGSNIQRKNECIKYYSIDDIPGNELSTHDAWFLKKCMCVPTSTIMQSLISPHSSGQ